jgi:hypothetical protein
MKNNSNRKELAEAREKLKEERQLKRDLQIEEIVVTEYKDIECHEEFSDIYMNSLYACKHIGRTEEDFGYCICDCTNDCYAKQKYYFEQYVGRIRNPQLVYAEINKDMEIICTKATEMRTRFATSEWFILTWLKDDQQATFSKISFTPSPNIEDCPKNEYNTFKGYAVNALKEPRPTKAQAKELLKPIFTHFEKLFNTKEEGDFVIKLFAYNIKYPTKKSENAISLIVQGNQGSGKSTLIENFLATLIGENYCTYTANIEDITGKHAEGLSSKIVVCLDEMEGKSTFDLSSRLKSLVTQDTAIVNAKGIRPFRIKNYSYMYFTTNNKTPISIEIGDRRYCVLQTTDVFRKNREYFKAQKAYMSRPDVMYSWYDYLMSLDVEDYDFCANRPKTKMYIEIVEACAPNTIKYLDYLIHDVADKLKDGIYGVNATILFENYVKWKQQTNHKDDLNSTSFGRAMTNVPGVSKDRKADGMKYFFDIEEIKEYFAKHNIFQNNHNNNNVKKEGPNNVTINIFNSSKDEEEEDITNITINIFNNNKTFDRPVKMAPNIKHQYEELLEMHQVRQKKIRQNVATRLKFDRKVSEAAEVSNNIDTINCGMFSEVLDILNGTD